MHIAGLKRACLAQICPLIGCVFPKLLYVWNRRNSKLYARSNFATRRHSCVILSLRKL